MVLLSDSLWIRQFIFRKIKNSGRQIGCRGGSGILALWLGVWLASAETVRPLPRMNLRIAGREQLSLSGRTQRRGRRLLPRPVARRLAAVHRVNLRGVGPGVVYCPAVGIVLIGTGCRRPTQCIGLPNSSINGSTPKCCLTESRQGCRGGLGRGC